MRLPSATCSLKNYFAPLCTRAQRAAPAAVIASSMIEIESQGFPSTHAMLCSHFNNIVEKLLCWPASCAVMIKIAQVIHQIYACTRKFNKSQWFDFSIFSLSNREMIFVGWSKKLSRIRWSNREICNLCAIHWVNVACNGMLTIGDGGRRQVSRPDHCARQ